MTPRLIPFEPKHLTMFVNRETGNYDRPPMESHRGPAFTAVVDDRVIGCAGIALTGVMGIVVAWCSFSEEIGRYPLWVTKTVRRVLNESMPALGIYQIEAIVFKDSERTCLRLF
jgi:hypothetical protein